MISPAACQIAARTVEHAFSISVPIARVLFLEASRIIYFAGAWNIESSSTFCDMAEPRTKLSRSICFIPLISKRALKTCTERSTGDRDDTELVLGPPFFPDFTAAIGDRATPTI